VRGLLVSAVVLFAVLSGTAEAATYAYDRELRIVARESLWWATSPDRPISRDAVLKTYVRCYRSENAFERSFERRYSESADRVIAYYAGGSDVFLRHSTCRDVHDFIDGRSTLQTAAAFSVLLHEVLHRQGVRDERITTCLANDAVRSGAEWIGYSDAQALRARELAFTSTRRYSPPSYRMRRSRCKLLNRRTDWPDHRYLGG
jgi:hypothetical protein